MNTITFVCFFVGGCIPGLLFLILVLMPALVASMSLVAVTVIAVVILPGRKFLFIIFLFIFNFIINTGGWEWR